MSVSQLAVFLENKAGRLAEVTRVLGDAGVSIRGFSVADTSEFGILRLIVDRPDAARDSLRGRGFTVHRSEVVCARIPDVPGGLASVLEVLGARGINIEYMYPIGIALIVFGIEALQEASRALEQSPVEMLCDEDIRLL